MPSIDWEVRLGFLIHDVSRLRRSALDRCLKPLGITRSQWWLLAYLSRNNGITQTKLAEEMDLGKVAIGGLVDRLERNELVSREADSNDRRIKRLFLTPKSTGVIKIMRAKIHQFNEEHFLEGVSESQLNAAARTLEKMKDNLLHYLSGDETAERAKAA